MARTLPGSAENQQCHLPNLTDPRTKPKIVHHNHVAPYQGQHVPEWLCDDPTPDSRSTDTAHTTEATQEENTEKDCASPRAGTPAERSTSPALR